MARLVLALAVAVACVAFARGQQNTTENSITVNGYGNIQQQSDTATASGLSPHCTAGLRYCRTGRSGASCLHPSHQSILEVVSAHWAAEKPTLLPCSGTGKCLFII